MSTPAKRQRLKAHATLNPHPDQVSDPLFGEHPFFDPCDLLQVKYEMLRRVAHEGWSITHAARQFGFSRPAYYQAQAAFAAAGLGGLVPRKRGPRGAHKLTAEVLAYVVGLRAAEPGLSPRVLAERIAERFGVQVHARSIERALQRQEKKRRPIR
jgi:transposase